MALSGTKNTKPAHTPSARSKSDRVRLALRDQLRRSRFLERVSRDLHKLFDLEESAPDPYETDAAKPGDIWDGDKFVPGGVAYGRRDT